MSGTEQVHKLRAPWLRNVAAWIVCLLGALPLLVGLALAMFTAADDATTHSHVAWKAADAATAALRDAADASAYLQRAGQVRDAAVRDGRVTYRQVLAAAYAPGVVTPELLRQKADYRARFAGEFIFFADYSAVTEAAVVAEIDAIPNPAMGSSLIGRYDSHTNRIDLARTAGALAVYHEAGHLVQRKSLPVQHAHRADDHSLLLRESPVFAQALTAAKMDERSQERLHYLSSQDEFEVRLQDLNRFFAARVAGHPISSPADSVRALAALGMPLDRAEIQTAFSNTGQALAAEDFDRLVAVARVPIEIVREEFDDAHELLILRNLAVRADRSLWQVVLRKIVFEAPGHL